MTLEEKNALYESIIKDVAKVVKKRINEYVDTESEYEPLPGSKYFDDIILNLIESKKDSYADKLENIQVDYEPMWRTYQIVHYGPEEHLTTFESFEDDILDLRSRLGRIFKFESWQVQVSDLNEIGSLTPYIKFNYKSKKILDVIIADINKNKEVITQFMNDHGYNLIRAVINRENGFVVGHLIFVDDNQENIASEILSNYDTLYHMTPSQNVERILRIGLSPMARNGKCGIYYPPRIFMSTNVSELQKYKKTLTDDHGDSSMSIICVDTHKLQPNADFYLDPLYGRPFVYTTKTIFSDAVSEYIEDDKDKQ